MFDKRKERELEELTPAALEAQKKQRSLNRFFGLFVIVAILLLAMFVVELVLIGKNH